MSNLGKKTINNGQHNKIVLESELDKYLALGWNLGGKPVNRQRSRYQSCKSCGKLISRFDNKHGLCRHCLTESGYFQNMWKNPEYRKKVIEGVTGKKRSDAFKKRQSEAMKRYYVEHPERRKAQGNVFSKAWAEGKHTKHFNKAGNVVYQHSAGENMMFNALQRTFGEHQVRRCVLTDNHSDVKHRAVYPDALINGVWLIEYYGDYFHANPKIYDADDDVCFHQKAADIWCNDHARLKYAENCESYVDLQTNERFDACPTIFTIIWEQETSQLKTQSDWDNYIATRFEGWDEILSI